LQPLAAAWPAAAAVPPAAAAPSMRRPLRGFGRMHQQLPAAVKVLEWGRK
jgi:hypothetical protein